MATLNLQVASGNDDNYEETNGNANHLSSTSLRLDTNTRLVAMEWRGASAIAGQTISNATLSLYGFSGSNLTINAEFYCQNASSPADLSAGANDISARTKTTAHVTLSATLSSAGYTTFDVTTVLSEVAAIGSFGGKIMGILTWNSGTTDISAYDQATTTKAAKLDITYGAAAAVNANFLQLF